MDIVRPAPTRRLLSLYIFLAGLCIRKTVQPFTLPHRELAIEARGFLALIDTLPVSLTLFLLEHACPPGRSLISQFVTYLSSLLYTNFISQTENSWNSNQSYASGGRNLLISPSLSSLTPFQILLKWLLAR
jgi:hypothetical protein